MKKIIVSIIAFFMLSGFSLADDAELYNLINEKTFKTDIDGKEYNLYFAGRDSELLSGVAWLTWPENITIDGYRYQIAKKMILPFSVWGGFIDIDSALPDGNINTFTFILDYQFGLSFVCPDLRFMPAAE